MIFQFGCSTVYYLQIAISKNVTENFRRIFFGADEFTVMKNFIHRSKQDYQYNHNLVDHRFSMIDD